MQFIPEQIYHVYNRGNNSQLIFYEERNYTFFLDKMKKHLCKFSEIICYCLMPNHFHFLLKIKPASAGNELNKEVGIMLRSYTRAINLQESRTGSLFQQKTKARQVDSYSNICFNYIHQNPVRAGIVEKIEEWKYSSFNDYLGDNLTKITNIDLGKELIDFKSKEDFYILSYEYLNEGLIENIF